MKRIFAVLFICISGIGPNFGQEDQGANNGNLYTFIVNSVNEQFKFPLVGFVNIARGNGNFPQIGLVNWTKNDFISLQSSFFNKIGGDLAGVQVGFLNTVRGDTRGLQCGFVNTTGNSVKGAQIGFVNSAAGEQVRGAQAGFINTAANDLNGAQISLVNVAGQLSGLQLGLFNYVDTVRGGAPVGLVSIVRNGGYRAVELSAAEIAPVALSFKTGIRKFYSSLHAAYRPVKAGFRDRIFLGFGFGSIIDINNIFFINPEVTSSFGIGKEFQSYSSFVPFVGCNINPNLGVLFGPSLTWYKGRDDKASFINLLTHRIDDDETLFFGGRIALRFQW
jgi:hypothetical protein